MAEHSIDMALQGGGSHGAFTWGVLDRFLQDPKIQIGGLSGTSAGAMNSVLVASGLGRGGRQGARDALAQFWKAVGLAGPRSLMPQTPLEMMFTPWLPHQSPMLKFFDVMSRLVSPYQLNPWNLNPLRTLLEQHVDFEVIRGLETPQVFVNATNVSSGQNRIFRNADISLEAVLASACLPMVFQAVEIDTEAYWDGGYAANPALLPLIAESQPNDLVLVQINPVERPGIPRTAPEIIDRINEISFNSSLNQELRTVALIKSLLKQEEASGHSYQAPLFAKIDALLLHRVEAQKEMRPLSAASKMNSEWGFISHLHDIGFDAAERWLAKHRSSLGKRSTIDLPNEFVAEPSEGSAELPK